MKVKLDDQLFTCLKGVSNWYDEDEKILDIDDSYSGLLIGAEYTIVGEEAIRAVKNKKFDKIESADFSIPVNMFLNHEFGSVTSDWHGLYHMVKCGSVALDKTVLTPLTQINKVKDLETATMKCQLRGKPIDIIEEYGDMTLGELERCAKSNGELATKQAFIRDYCFSGNSKKTYDIFFDCERSPLSYRIYSHNSRSFDSKVIGFFLREECRANVGIVLKGDEIVRVGPKQLSQITYENPVSNDKKVINIPVENFRNMYYEYMIRKVRNV